MKFYFGDDFLKYKSGLIVSMLIFGTIGILRRHIGLSSGALAMLRGYIGAACLIIYMLLRGRRPDMAALRRSIWRLLISGAFIGLNWMLLFEAYNHTSVATATLCYYMAPVMVTLLSPVVLKEKLTRRQLICAAVAAIGMIPVSGILSVGGFAVSEIKGVLLGLGAAALYGCVILMNKRIAAVGAMDRTVVQLIAAAVVVTPYVFAAEGFAPASMTGQDILLTLAAGIIYTGAAYALYFGSIIHLPARTVALVSYIDPISAVILSAALLGESMSPIGWVGAAVMLGAMAVSELPGKK